MSALLLRVAHPDPNHTGSPDGSRVYTYSDVTEDFEDGGEPSRASKATADGQEVEDIELLLDGTFLGASLIDALPLGDDGTAAPAASLTVEDAAYRAELVEVDAEGNEAPVTNGVIRRRGGVIHEPEAARWVLVVEDDAAERFRSALDFDLRARWFDLQQTAIDNGIGFLTEVNRNVYQPVYSGDLLVTTGVEDTTLAEFWIELEGFLACVFLLAGHVWNGPGSAAWATATGHSRIFTAQVEDEGGDFYAHESRVAFVGVFEGEPSITGLTGHTALQLFQAVQAMRGWSLVAAYGAFPSAQITAAVTLDREDPAASVTAIDDFLEGAVSSGGAASGTTPREITEARLPDLAFAYANHAEVERVEFQVQLYDGSTYGHLYTPHPTAVRQAVRGIRLGADGEVENADTVALPFYRPHVGLPVAGEQEAVDAANHPGLVRRVHRAERLGFFDEEGRVRTGLYIGEIVPDPDDAGRFRYAVWTGWGGAYVGGVADPAYATNAVNPGDLLQNYALALKESVEVAVEIDVSDSGLPGGEAAVVLNSPSHLLSLEGQRYIDTEKGYFPDRKTVRAVLRRPVGQAPSLPGTAAQAPPPALSAAYDCSGYDAQADAGMVVTFTWDAPDDPGSAFGAVDHYEYRVSPPGAPYGPVQATGDGATTNLDLSGGVGFWGFQVRAVYGDGSESAERSAWAALQVVAEACPDVPQDALNLTLDAEAVDALTVSFDEVAGIDGVRFEVALDAGITTGVQVSYVPVGDLDPAVGGRYTHTLSGLDSGDEHFVRATVYVEQDQQEIE